MYPIFFQEDSVNSNLSFSIAFNNNCWLFLVNLENPSWVKAISKSFSGLLGSSRINSKLPSLKCFSVKKSFFK